MDDRQCEECSAPKRNYGVSLEWYEAAVESRDGRCDICGRRPTGGGQHGKLHVDHCHKSLAVRGLLCSSCNAGMGQFGDSVDVMRRAIAYLENPRIALSET